MADIIFNALYIIIFFGGLYITIRILLDTNLPSIFKQGKVGSIRACYIILAVIISSLFAWGLVELMKCCYNIIS